MRIGLLQCGHIRDSVAETYGNYPALYARLLAGHGFDWAVYDVEAMQFPASIHDCDGWLISGSRHGAYETHDFIPPLEEFIRDAHENAVPLVGICFGHQIIAQALGGKVEKFAGGWAVGHTEYQLEGETVHLNAWHQDQVTRIPQGATTIGQNAFCQHAALIYDAPIYSIQPHPEFEGGLVAAYADLLRGSLGLPDALMDRARALKDAPDDNARLGQRIAAFFLQAHAKTREASHA